MPVGGIDPEQLIAGIKRRNSRTKTGPITQRPTGPSQMAMDSVSGSGAQSQGPSLNMMQMPEPSFTVDKFGGGGPRPNFLGNGESGSNQRKSSYYL